MATNLPSNTTYEAGIDSAPQPSSIASYSGALRAIQGRPSPAASITPPGAAASNRKSFSLGEVNVPGDTPVGESPTQRYTPLPTDYGGFVNPYRTSEQIQTPEGLQVRSLPGITPGQYVINPQKPTELFKSAREYIPEEKSLILGNRPSNLYQVDHIIPIWAGGADTAANKEVLTLNKHRDKTTAQAVPLTLLANKKITLAQARMMAMQWDKYDISDVPSVEETGMMPVDVAEKIKKRWEDQEANPHVTWRNFLDAIPDSTKGIDKSNLPAPIKEFSKGVVSGVTGGWVPYQPAEGTGIGSLVTGIAGNVAGMLLPVTVMSRMLGALGKTVSGVAEAQGFIKGTSAAERAAKIANFIQAGTFGGKYSTQGARTFIKNVAYGNLARNTGAMVLYGQLSKYGFENRTSNFIENLGYAAASGVMPPSIKGAVGAALAATTIGLMADQDAKEALVNGLVMGALHTAAIKGTRINFEKGLQDAKLLIEREATRGANNVLSAYTPEQAPFLKPQDPVPQITSYGNVLAIREAAITKINRLVADDTIDIDTAARERARVLVATNWLESGKLPDSAKNQKAVQDLLSVKDQVERLEGGTLTTPSIIKNVVDQMDESWMKTSFRSHDTDIPTGENPVGTIRLSGLGASELNEEGAKYYLSAKAENRASPTLFTATMPELETMMRAIGNAYTPEQIAQKLQKPFMNPQNSMPVYGVVQEAGGTKTIVRVGWIPREFKVGHPDPKVEQSSYSFNQTPMAKDFRARGETLSGTDRSLNKDTLSEGLNRKGSRILFLNYVEGGLAKKEPNKPFMVVSLNDENWKVSVDFMRKLSGANKQAGMPSLIKQITNTRDAKQKTSLIQEMRDRVKNDADEVLKSAPKTEISPEMTNARTTTEELLTAMRKSLDSDSPITLKAAFEKNLTLKLTDEEATHLFNNKANISTKEMLGVVTNVIKDGRANPILRATIVDYVIPYTKSAEYKTWELSSSFPSMKMLGGMEPPVFQRTTLTKPREGTLTPEDIRLMRKQGFGEDVIARIQSAGRTKPIEPKVQTTPYAQPTEKQIIPTEKKTQTPAIEPPAIEPTSIPMTTKMPVSAVPQRPTAGIFPITQRIVNARAKIPMETRPITKVEGADAAGGLVKQNVRPVDKILSSTAIKGGQTTQRGVVESEAEQFILQGKDSIDNTVLRQGEGYSLPIHEKRYDAEIERAITASRVALADRNDLDVKTIRQIQQNIREELERYKRLRINSISKQKPLEGFTDYMPPELLPSKEPVGNVTATIDSFFTSIDDGLGADKTSPAYFYAKAQDEAFTALLGPKYRENEALRGLIPTFFNDIFFGQVSKEGRAFTQPKNVIEAAAKYGNRSPEFYRAISESKSTPKGATEAERESAKKLALQGMRLSEVEPTVADLTYGEAYMMPGLASEQKMTPSVAVRAVTGLFVTKNVGLRDQLQRILGKKLPNIPFERIEKEAKLAEKVVLGGGIPTKELEGAKTEIRALIEKYKMLEKAVAEEPEKVYLSEALADTKAGIEKYMKILNITKGSK